MISFEYRLLGREGKSHGRGWYSIRKLAVLPGRFLGRTEDFEIPTGAAARSLLLWCVNRQRLRKGKCNEP